MKNERIIQALEQAGLSDRVIAQGLKQHIEDGMGIKPTADTSLRALDLVTRLKGYQERSEPNNLTQNNVNIELRGLSEEELEARLNSLTGAVTELQEANQ